MIEHSLDTAYDNLVAFMEANPEYVEFAIEDIAKPELVYATDRLLLKKHTRSSGGYIADQVLFIVPRNIFRRLGLLIAATLMHNAESDPLIRINLNNQASELKTLFIDCRSSKVYFGECFEGAEP